MGLEPPFLMPPSQEIQEVDDASEGLLGVKGWMTLMELSSSVFMSCRSEFISLRSPLEGRNSEWNEPAPVQAVCMSQDTHLPGLPGTAPKLSLFLCRADSYFSLHRLQEIRKIKWGIGPPGSPGQLREPRMRLGTQTRAAHSILLLRVLVLFSSATVVILHFWRLFQREENQWFKPTKILEGLKKIFILSKAKWLRLIMSMHL